MERSEAAVPLETLGREVFRAPLAQREVLEQILTPLLAQLPQARINEVGWVLWEAPPPKTTSLAETRFVVVDVETTGSSTRTSRITEVALFAVQNGKVEPGFTSLVNPLMEIPPMITDLTGITNQMVATAPRFVEIADQVADYLAEAVIVAHNAPFDCAFLRLEFGHWDAGFDFLNESLCTVHLARHLVPGLENYKLHTVAEHFGVTIVNRHRAAGDALATAQVFRNLLELMREQGVTTLEGAANLKKERKRRKLAELR
ncbi:MAG: hypothetical protein K1Y36_10875 [Blastocatellia bacterium]|nr:hypothetical protein [Blastocatellia bacterium]